MHTLDYNYMFFVLFLGNIELIQRVCILKSSSQVYSIPLLHFLFNYATYYMYMHVYVRISSQENTCTFLGIFADSF